jgi:hypothetical protein
MRKIYSIILWLLVYHPVSFGQPAPVNSQQFFLDDSVIEVTLTTDIKKLRTEKKLPTWQPANITMRFNDTSVISEQIRIEPRGVTRKTYCDIASLYLNFKNPSSPILSPLKKLKLVGGCRSGAANEELLLREYLVYKIYNLLSVMSFRVRLLHINYKDSKEKVKPYSQYAFLMEDMKDMAERNNCAEKKNKTFATEATNRQQITFVSVFQYMIGNTDWAIPNYHNIKLMVPKNDTLATPYPVPYDFDYAGFVNAPYAVPAEGLDISNVRERSYRGFERSMEELQPILDVFKEKKQTILLTINNFSLLGSNEKKDMTKYIEQFYDIIEHKGSVKSVFIDNARRN